VTVGQDAALSVGADWQRQPDLPVVFQRHGVSERRQHHGVATPVLDISNTQAGNSGNYTVKITNGFGNLTTSVAVLTVLGLPSNTTGLDWRRCKGP